MVSWVVCTYVMGGNGFAYTEEYDGVSVVIVWYCWLYMGIVIMCVIYRGKYLGLCSGMGYFKLLGCYSDW